MWFGSMVCGWGIWHVVCGWEIWYAVGEYGMWLGNMVCGWEIWYVVANFACNTENQHGVCYMI